eukprot:scaffold19703_cov143-Isochrysis_galbana.AAC.1
MGEEWERGGGVSGRQGTEVSHRVAARRGRLHWSGEVKAALAVAAVITLGRECKVTHAPGRK